MSYLDSLLWRYATKRMTGEKLREDKLHRILEAIRNSPSSFGMQPYEILVIESNEWKEKLKPHAFNQSQITGCSHLLIFAYYNAVTSDHVDAYIQRIHMQRGSSIDSLQEFRENIQESIDKRSLDANQIWASKQTYIGLGFGLVAAALEGVDACPMEGFEPRKFDQVLGLEAKNLRSACLLALGVRDPKDKYAKEKKVRKNFEELFHFYR